MTVSSQAEHRLVQFDALTSYFAIVMLLGSALGAMVGYAIRDPQAKGAGQCRSFADILQNNVGVLSVVFVLAIVSLGVLAALFLLYSFWIVGFQIGQSILTNGWVFTIDGVVWHLPFELLAIALVPAAATRWGLESWAVFKGPEGRRAAHIRASSLTCIARGASAVTLLATAALTEATMSSQC